MNIVVLIPAYNEADKIAETLTQVIALRKTPEFSKITLSIFVIDDGSIDNTGNIAKKTGADKVLKHSINLGLGAAVRTGLKAAAADGFSIAVKFDADLQHAPNDIIRIIQPLINEEADVVYGNRFEKIEYRMPIVRKLGNVVFTKLMQWLTGWPLKDSQPGIIAVNNKYLNNFYIPGDYNYTQQILLDAYHKGMRFAHVPVNFRERKTGHSFVSYKYPFKVIPQIIMVLVSVRPMRVFASLGLFFLFLAGMIFATEITMFFLGKIHKPVVHVNATLGLALFGLQTLFFGILAELIVRLNRK